MFLQHQKPMTTLLLATRNRHKVGEIRMILGPHFRYLTLDDFTGAPAVVEDATTFVGNATKKAWELANWITNKGLSGCGEVLEDVSVLADDSGLEVDALDGAPGVHSARFAALDTGMEGNSSDTANNSKLLRLMTGIPVSKRTARFRCVMALCPLIQAAGAGSERSWPPANNSPVTVFEGVCEGRILAQASGAGGFGYDPLFVPIGMDKSFAELGDEIKNQISHRANALRLLKSHLV